MSERHGELLPPVRPARADSPARAKTTPAALPAAERAFFERRLGRDFGRVRVFTDEGAAAASAALGARAFAAGDQIAYAAGRYRPGTEEGRRTLGHELVHVAQQGRGGSASRADVEVKADTAAERLAAGEAVPASQQGGAPPGVYCEPDDKKKDLHETHLTLSEEPLVPLRHMPTTPFLHTFGLHGTTPSMMGFDVQEDWTNAYLTFRNYMSEDLAAKSATRFLSTAYQSTLARDVPNGADLSARDFAAAHPNDVRTPIVSVDLLDLFRKNHKKRKAP